MRHFALAVLTVGMMVGAPGRPARGDEASPLVKEELAKFQGAWQLVSAETDGVKAPEEQVKKVRVIIKGASHSVRIGDQVVVHDVVFSIDPTKSPKEAADTLQSGPDKGKQIRSIYKLEGDTLTSCVARVGEPRPTEFATRPGSGHTLRVFRRVKTVEDSTSAAVEAEQKRFEGSWRFVSMEMEGKDITANLGADDRLILKGDHFTSKTHRGTVDGTYKVDLVAKPKTIDLSLTINAQTGTILGIYELEGDTYKICSALPGKPRPIAFDTAPGSGSSVTVMERVNP